MRTKSVNSRLPSYSSFFLPGLLAVLVTGLPSDSLAQDDLALEEVMVTATKREKGLQDVPIAISVISGDKIEAGAIGELEDLALMMPNVHIAEGGTGTNLFIRGIGSGINFGFEQSVDGVLANDFDREGDALTVTHMNGIPGAIGR